MQVGGWYGGRQFGSDGSLSNPGEYNPTVSGQTGMAPAQNAQDQAFINQQRTNPTPPTPIPQQYTNPAPTSIQPPTPTGPNSSLNANPVNPLARYGPGSVGGFPTSNTQADLANPIAKYPNLSGVMPVNASSAALTRANIPGASAMSGNVNSGNPQGEKTGEVPSDTIDRTHVVHGTPSWVIPILQTVSRKYNIPTAVLSGVANQESGFIANRVQPDGLGRGMFQLDLGQHKDVTEAEAFDPKFSADYAAKLLREGFDRTGSWSGALRYYNGGPNYNSNNPGYQGQPVSQLTQRYANSVLGFAQDTIPVLDQAYQKKVASSLGS